MARIKGNKLSLSVATKEWAGEVKQYILESADLADPTFAQAAAGEADWTLKLTVEQDLGGTDAAYKYLWANAGSTGVDCVLAPYGNAVPSATEPHLEFKVTLPRKPTLGGQASMDGKPLTTEVELVVETPPTLKTSAS